MREARIAVSAQAASVQAESVIRGAIRRSVYAVDLAGGGATGATTGVSGPPTALP
jgi:hypothetical protein